MQLKEQLWMGYQEVRLQSRLKLFQHAVYLPSLQHLGHPVHHHVLLPLGQVPGAVAGISPGWRRSTGSTVVLHVLKGARRHIQTHPEVRQCREDFVKNNLGSTPRPRAEEGE